MNKIYPEWEVRTGHKERYDYSVFDYPLTQIEEMEGQLKYIICPKPTPIIQCMFGAGYGHQVIFTPLTSIEMPDDWGYGRTEEEAWSNFHQCYDLL
jgi:hypothetical protein